MGSKIAIPAAVNLYAWNLQLDGVQIEGILPKEPYPQCLRTADRALWAEYSRNMKYKRVAGITNGVETCKIDMMAMPNKNIPDNKVHGTYMGPTWGRQVGPTLANDPYYLR